jgi:hypothetical protein
MIKKMYALCILDFEGGQRNLINASKEQFIQDALLKQPRRVEEELA